MDNLLPELPECQLPMPSTLEKGQTEINTDLHVPMAKSKEVDDKIVLPSGIGGRISTKASFRAWISSDFDKFETEPQDFKPESYDPENEEVVIHKKNFLDLSTLIAWEEEEAKRLTRTSSLTRQRPSSSLNTPACLEEEILTESPFKQQQQQQYEATFYQDTEADAMSDPQVESQDQVDRDTTESDSGYVLVSQESQAEKVSLKTRILWKIKKFRKWQSKKRAEKSK